MVNLKCYKDLTDNYDFFDSLDDNTNKVTIWKCKTSEEMIVVKKIDKHMTHCITDGLPNDYIYPMKFNSHVIKPIDLYESESDFCIIYPYKKDLITLRDWLRDVPPSYQEMKGILRQTVDFVSQCRDVHVLHGDLRPDNIMIDRASMNIHVIDFSDSRPLVEYYHTSISDIIELPESNKGEPFTFDGINVWSIGLILYGLVQGVTEIEPDDDVYMLNLPSDLNNKLVEILFVTLKTNPSERITFDALKALIYQL